MEKFAKENNNLVDCTQTWSINEEKIKKDKNGMYTTSYVCLPHSFAVAMLCRLFGKPDRTKFSPEWLSLIDATINTTVMNRAQILSDNLAKTIIEYRRKRSVSSRVYPPFFMSAYFMDTICFSSKFHIMGWKWTNRNPLPIHIYHKDMWESNFQPHFFQIFHGVMLPIYKWLYNRDAPKFSQEVEVDILPMAKWFREETFTYIRVFGSITSPHMLPYYVPDKLMAKEISHQIASRGGMIYTLKESKKAFWPALPVQCEAFSLHDLGHAFKEEKNILPLQLPKFLGR